MYSKSKQESSTPLLQAVLAAALAAVLEAVLEAVLAAVEVVLFAALAATQHNTSQCYWPCRRRLTFS
jgi:hypothetical protein